MVIVFLPESTRLNDVMPRPQAKAPKALTPLLEIRNLTKSFDGQHAVDDVSLTIYKGEIFALLGASGCGKSTLLRMLAGFEQPTAGQIMLDGVDLARVPPYQRPINMMFQSYALFPHMTVEQNIAFGLKQDRLPKAEITARVQEMLALVHMQEFAKRKPHQLSGGQRQRVALARAIVGRPSILLMDEPLSALDAELKISMRQEIQDVHRRTGATILYVTHDQSEALAMADRILVMREGAIEQVGTPQDIYAHPETEFVASFVSKCNMVKGQWDRQVFKVADRPLVYDGRKVANTFKQKGLYPIRPEQFKIVRGGDGLPATIINRQYNGREIQYSLRCGTDTFTVFAGCDEQFDLGEDVYLIFDV